MTRSLKTERSDCLESASLQLCAEESIFLEPAGRRRRKVAPLNSLLRWFASRNSASPNSLVDADANETTSLNSLLCSLASRNPASLNSLVDAKRLL